MIRRILSISGKPGLFRLVSQGKNMLIVEALQTGKRMPAYAHDKVISLGDVAIYTTGDDMPLPEVLDKVAAKTGTQPVDVKGFADDKALREYFREILPEFDDDRVYTTDIRKLFSWYNQLLAAGFTKFTEEMASAAEPSQSAEAKAE